MNKIKYEKRMKELDQIAEEQQLRQQVRTDRRTGGHVWGVLGVCTEIRKREHQGRHCVRHEHKTGRN